jgi:hypothetical protein
MIQKDFENLENEFDIVKSEPKEIVVIQPQEVSNEINLDAEKDYVQIRNNLKDIAKKGSEAIDGILKVASETDHPRAYEVVATLIKSVADVNKDLLGMHKQMKEIRGTKDTQSRPAQVTNNSIFVGSTKDLQDLIKGKMKQIEEIE